METDVIVAVIGAAALVTATALPLLVSIRKHAKSAASNSAETRYQTANDHRDNLRDDLDVVIVGLHKVLVHNGIEDTHVRARHARIRERNHP